MAESWELSTHKDGQSVVCTGEHAGKTLSQYIRDCGRGVLGKRAEAFEYFPILIKLIDAKDNLSVQVHPDDAYGLANEGEYGKTEMWYILDCEEGACLYYGLNQTISREEFRRRIENNTLLEVLNRVEVEKGDVFFIQSGTVHAIGKGIVICEIQQNSNTTYRVYDYDRRDKDGNPRQLHIDRAVEVSNLCPPAVPVKKQGSCDREELASCKYFTVNRLTVAGERTVQADPECFQSLIVVEGSGELSMNGEVLSLIKGDSVFVPAQMGEYLLKGEMNVILSYV